MNKVLLGLLLGALLGAIDGATAWFTPAVRAHSWRCCGHFCSKGEFRPFGNPFRCGGWLRTRFPRCVHAARLLLRDHLARQYRWNDRGLRYAKVRSGSGNNAGDAVNFDFER